MRKTLYWIPRILSVMYPAVIILITIIDSFRLGFNAGGFAIMFALFLIMTALVVIGWKWPRVGGALFILLSGVVVINVLNSEIGFEWLPLLTGALPFAVIGVTYLVSSIKTR